MKRTPEHEAVVKTLKCFCSFRIELIKGKHFYSRDAIIDCLDDVIMILAHNWINRNKKG